MGVILQVLKIIARPVGREKRQLGNYHIRLCNGLAGKAGFQLVVTYKSIKCTTCSAYAAAAAASAHILISRILYCLHDGKGLRDHVLPSHYVNGYHLRAFRRDGLVACGKGFYLLLFIFSHDGLLYFQRLRT